MGTAPCVSDSCCGQGRADAVRGGHLADREQPAVIVDDAAASSHRVNDLLQVHLSSLASTSGLLEEGGRSSCHWWNTDPKPCAWPKAADEIVERSPAL